MGNTLSCVNATNGCRVYNDGSLQLCCMSSELLTNENNDIASVTVDDIETVLHTGNAVEIRTALANGKQHPNCKRCWDEETAGIPSKRIRDNVVHQFDDNSLKIIELNLGTICNLKCRICGPWSSNQWHDDYTALLNNIVPKPINVINEHNNNREKWTNSFDDDSLFWKGFENILPTLETISVYGGEPLLVDKQWEILKESADKEYSKNQKIEFNTNGTVFDIEKLKILRGFKIVNIGVSIDDLGPRFEYQRYPAKWTNVRDNLLKFKDACTDFNFNLSVCVTMSNYNIFYIDELLQFLVDNELSFYINMLHDPSHYSILNLHPDIKNIVIAKLNNLKKEAQNSGLRTSYVNIVNYLNSSKPEIEHWQSFENTFPEYHDIIMNCLDDI